jgi:hypothetical protein
MENFSMVAIARTSMSPSASAGMPARTSPNLEAQMRTCRAQLADWVTCPSAKTPEGNAKIEQISFKLDSIEGQIKKSGVAPPSLLAQPDDPLKSARRAEAAVDKLAASGQIGSNVDTYA